MFYESDGMGINLLKEILLQVHLVLNELNRFLDHSTSIGVLRKIDDFAFDCFKEFLFLFLSTFLEYFLKDIVSKSIFHKRLMFFENKTKNQLFNVLFTSFKDILYRTRSILVSRPFPHLWKIIQ